MVTAKEITAAVKDGAKGVSPSVKGFQSDLCPGTIVGTLHGYTVRVGHDIHSVARGGTKMTRRNKVTITSPNGIITWYSVKEVKWAIARINRIEEINHD